MLTNFCINQIFSFYILLLSLQFRSLLHPLPRLAARRRSSVLAPGAAEPRPPVGPAGHRREPHLPGRVELGVVGPEGPHDDGAAGGEGGVRQAVHHERTGHEGLPERDDAAVPVQRGGQSFVLRVTCCNVASRLYLAKISFMNMIQDTHT